MIFVVQYVRVVQPVGGTIHRALVRVCVRVCTCVLCVCFVCTGDGCPLIQPRVTCKCSECGHARPQRHLYRFLNSLYV